MSEPLIKSGRPANDVASKAPEKIGLIDDARLRGTAVTLAAAVRSAGVTTAITNEVRVGTSICASADRTSSRARTIVRLEEKAARMRQMLDGMCVKPMVLTNPSRCARRAATGYEKALRTFDQKKNTLAVANDRLNCSNSQSASSDCTVNPPAKASTLNSA